MARRFPGSKNYQEAQKRAAAEAAAKSNPDKQQATKPADKEKAGDD